MNAGADAATSARQLPEDPDWQPASRNVSALAATQTDDRGHAPYVTFYDDDSGERTELSYATFDNWASKTANLLVEELEVSPGDRVATVLGNHWTTIVVTFACWKVGASVVPVDADGPFLETVGVLAASGARTAFVREDLLDDLADLRGRSSVEQVVLVGMGPAARLLATHLDTSGDTLGYAEEVLAFGDEYHDPDVGLDDDALVVYSPGGGEHGAGVRLTQRNVLAAADAMVGWGLGPHDRLLVAQPLQVADALGLVMVGAFAAGASLVLTRVFDAERFWSLTSQERVTLGVLTPRNLDALAGSGKPEDPSERFRGLACPTGASRDIAYRVTEGVGVSLFEGHGLVEASCASTLMPANLDGQTRAWLADTGEAGGRPIGCATHRAAVTALGGDGEPVAHGASGQLGVRGPVVMAGYDGRPDLDEHVFADGWLLTREQGFTDVGPDGRTYAFVTGRAS